MWISIGLILLGLVLLVAGAEMLVRGSVGMALRLGLTPLVIGLTVVAFGTSSPELVVSLNAAMSGNSDIALGNIVGSNICNIALILGLSALIQPLHVQASVLRRDMPIMIGASVLLMVFLLDGEISRIEGGFFVLGIIAYTWYSIRLARLEPATIADDAIADASKSRLQSLPVQLLFIAAGLGLLMGGAHYLVKGAIDLATLMGMSQAVIGLTIVAVGTSMPELATSVLAAYKKEGDIAIGNVIGSNIFNILCILGVSALIVLIFAGGISWVDLIVMLAIAVILFPALRTGYTLSRLEGAFFLVLYVIYTVYLVSNS